MGSPAENAREDLFRRVVAACRLSPLIGPGTVIRALRHVGATKETATNDDYRRALPNLRVRLEAYVGSVNAASSVEEISGILNEGPTA